MVDHKFDILERQYLEATDDAKQAFFPGENRHLLGINLYIANIDARYAFVSWKDLDTRPSISMRGAHRWPNSPCPSSKCATVAPLYRNQPNTDSENHDFLLKNGSSSGNHWQSQDTSYMWSQKI